MSTFPIFQLPTELVLGTLQHLRPRDLINFCRTCIDARRQGYAVLYSLSLEEKKRVFLWAAENAQVNIIQHLTGITDYIRQNTEYGTRAMVCAARGGREHIALLLRALGVHHSHRALKAAIDADKPGMVNILLGPGIGILDFPYFRSQSRDDGVFRYAVMQGSLEVVKWHFSEPTLVPHINGIDAEENTALIDAATLGDTDMIAFLLEKQAKVNLYNKDGEGPLSCAAARGFKQVVKQLLDAGADIDHQDPLMNRTPLYYAVENGHTSTVQVLLDAGANPNPIDAHEVHPLLLAARHNHVDTLKLILPRCRAYLNVLTRYGMTPLMTAASQNLTPMVKLLIDNGADLECMGIYGTAYRYALVDEAWDTARFLLKAGCRYAHWIEDYTTRAPQDLIDLARSSFASSEAN